jgi:hypothetical protein
MTHSVAATSAAATPAETTRAPASRATGASFAAVHTAAVQDAEDKAKGRGSKDAPKGERTQKVPGHSYVEIISGPRNGMFINNTGNTRDGEAFLIVRRHGREFHIYGTGKDRAVYEVGRERESAPAAGTTGTGTTGTTGASTPVPGGTTATT